MKENIVGFLVIAGVIAWLLSKHSYLLKPLLFLGAAVFGILLFAFIGQARPPLPRAAGRTKRTASPRIPAIFRGDAGYFHIPHRRFRAGKPPLEDRRNKKSTKIIVFWLDKCFFSMYFMVEARRGELFSPYFLRLKHD